MKVLLGLGNPGDEHRATRHNAGFLVAEEFLRRHGAGRPTRRCRSLVAVAGFGGMEVLVARPLTFMNRSGEAAAALLGEAACGPADLLVACDDLYLELGTIRLRPGGGHGGHNGLRSILEVLGSREIPRLRLGVGPPAEGMPHAAFVLEPFRRSERGAVEAMVTRAADAAETALREGVPAAMNRFNRRERPDAPGTDRGTGA